MTGPRYAFPILRSKEDGHQVVGPWIADRVGIEAYKRFAASRVMRLWKLEGFVWVSEKPPQEGFGLIAEPIDEPTRRPVYVALTRRR